MKHLITAAALAALLSACASGPNVSVAVTNRPVAQDSMPAQVEVFRSAEKVYAMATVTGELASAATLKAKWYNGSTVRTTSKPQTVHGTPGVASFIVPASTLGPGACSVDIYLNDVKVGSQKFTIGGN
jgi:hypothetical protein